MAKDISAAQRDKLAQRLEQTNAYNDDDGRADPVLAKALAVTLAQAQIETVVDALNGACRLLVPVHPAKDIESGHCQDRGYEQKRAGLGALVVFSGIQAFMQWDKRARPVPLPAHRCALLARQVSGRLWLDPGGADVLIERPAVKALQLHEPWLAPWRDEALEQELQSLAKQVGGISALTWRYQSDRGLGLMVGLEDHCHEPVQTIERFISAAQLLPTWVKACDRVNVLPYRINGQGSQPLDIMSPRVERIRES